MRHILFYEGHSRRGVRGKNIIVRKGEKVGAFVCGLLLFGAAVYIVSTVLFKGLFGDFIPIDAFSVSF